MKSFYQMNASEYSDHIQKVSNRPKSPEHFLRRMKLKLAEHGILRTHFAKDRDHAVREFVSRYPECAAITIHDNDWDIRIGTAEQHQSLYTVLSQEDKEAYHYLNHIIGNDIQTNKTEEQETFSDPTGHLCNKSEHSWNSFVANRNQYYDGHLVGSIQYLDTSGKIREEQAYHDPDKLRDEIRASCYVGRPVSLVLYSDSQGRTIPKDVFLLQDPPLVSLRIEKHPDLMSQNSQQQISESARKPSLNERLARAQSQLEEMATKEQPHTKEPEREL